MTNPHDLDLFERDRDGRRVTEPSTSNAIKAAKRICEESERADVAETEMERLREALAGTDDLIFLGKRVIAKLKALAALDGGDDG